MVIKLMQIILLFNWATSFNTDTFCVDSKMDSPIDIIPPIEYKAFDMELKPINTEVARITKLSDHDFKIQGEFGLAVFNMEPYAI
jgi:hypothetical protein